MFFGTNEILVRDVEVFKLERKAYRRSAGVRNFHAISFRICGDAKYEMKDRTITTKAGDLLFVPANVPYTKDTSQEQFYVVHFYSDSDLGERLLHMTPADPEKYRYLYEGMLDAQAKKAPGYRHRLKGFLYQLFSEMEKEYVQKHSSPIDVVLNKSIQIIHERCTETDFSIAGLAGELNICETYFRRIFLHAKGVSPKKYIAALKLEMAKNLLRSGYYSVGEVASQCGFSSVYYFSAFMKRVSGKSPKQWVEEMTEK